MGHGKKDCCCGGGGGCRAVDVAAARSLSHFCPRLRRHRLRPKARFFCLSLSVLPIAMPITRRIWCENCLGRSRESGHKTSHYFGLTRRDMGICCCCCWWQQQMLNTIQQKQAAKLCRSLYYYRRIGSERVFSYTKLLRRIEWVRRTS